MSDVDINSVIKWSTCDYDDKIIANVKAENPIKDFPGDMQTIDSILSTDDSILRDIETSIDKDKELNDFFERNKSMLNLIRDEESIDSCLHEYDLSGSVNEMVNNTLISPNVVTVEETKWQDNTLLNEAFSQLNCSFKPLCLSPDMGNLIPTNNLNEHTIREPCKTSAVQHLQNSSEGAHNNSIETCLEERNEIDDMSALYISNLSDEIMENICTDDLESKNVLKSKQNSSSNGICDVPLKRQCLNISKAAVQSAVVKDVTNICNSSSNKAVLFYGLPNEVQDLFKKIKGIDKLYQWQDECLNLPAVEKRKNLIYALPTSGGKTLVAEILMLKEIVCNKRNAIFILPFVALVQEKVYSMAPFALELDFLVEEYAASKGQYPPKKRRKKNSVYICTIEKALGLINSLIEEKRFHEIGIIVVDELHLLGESGGRGATLEGLLTKAMHASENIHIVGMSATIGNLEEIAKFLNADLYTQNFRPIQIKEYVKCEDDLWLVDSRSEEILIDREKINYPYSNSALKIDPDKIGGLVMDVVPQDSCLIFCSSRKNCENVALLLTKVLFRYLIIIIRKFEYRITQCNFEFCVRSLEDHKRDEKLMLINALRTEEGLCPILKETIRFGVAYHHSGLTSEERRFLEDAFRAGTLCVICCTSTLAAGVNLPARRVILRSPYIGNQFMNLSRYKQMIGRAGRAGMGEIGESIFICRKTELPKVKTLLTSKMDDSLSTLHTEKDRGIYNLILSAVVLSMAMTRQELHKLIATTLLSIQQTRLGVNVKQVTDEAIIMLIKYGVMKVKKLVNYESVKPNVSVIIPSQGLDEKHDTTEAKKKRTIPLTSETELELCNFGRAVMKGSVDLQYAYILYEDLKQAQRHLILLDCLHLLYLVTPYSVVSQVKPVGSVYYDVVVNLSPTQLETARLLGINEVTVSKLRDGIMPKNVDERVVHRFYVTLILLELWNHHAVYSIAEKYHVNRGIIQNLLNAVSSFASSIVRFCEELDEFWSFRNLLDTFSKKLSYCCPLELEALMELPSVKIGRARQLYNAGYTTLQSIAKCNPKDLQEKIPYLSKKSVAEIINTANLLILEKVEDLRDEAADVLDGIDQLGMCKI